MFIYQQQYQSNNKSEKKVHTNIIDHIYTRNMLATRQAPNQFRHISLTADTILASLVV